MEEAERNENCGYEQIDNEKLWAHVSKSITKGCINNFESSSNMQRLFERVNHFKKEARGRKKKVEKVQEKQTTVTMRAESLV